MCTNFKIYTSIYLLAIVLQLSLLTTTFNPNWVKDYRNLYFNVLCVTVLVSRQDRQTPDEKYPCTEWNFNPKLSNKIHSRMGRKI